MKIPFRRIFKRRTFRSGTCKKRGRQEPSFPAQRFKKSLAEFAARRRQRDFDYFLSGRVPDRKYNSGCKCASCPLTADKTCAQQTAILLSKMAKPFLTVSIPRRFFRNAGGAWCQRSEWAGISSSSGFRTMKLWAGRCRVLPTMAGSPKV